MGDLQFTRLRQGYAEAGKVQFTIFKVVMNGINMGEKVELTVLQLVYLLDDAMETMILRAEDGQVVNTLEIAQEKVLELVKKQQGRQTEVCRSEGKEGQA